MAALTAHSNEALPAGAWKAEVYVFYVLTACAVALLAAGRFSLRGGAGPRD